MGSTKNIPESSNVHSPYKRPNNFRPLFTIPCLADCKTTQNFKKIKNMLGLISLPNPQTPFPISLNQSNPTPKSPFPKFQPLPLTQKLQKKLILQATQETKNGLKPEPDNKNGFKKDELEDKEDLKKDNEMPKFNFKWVDLVLDPDPQNIVAVALTGLLTWASVQVLWQLFLISLAILVAALKYSFIAALLLFILITLL